ncbi:MAG: hypothetical protein JSS00_02980 [Proteobacteria bacterium]|nr:hypothetical protein [Pseudomonadota bacterium]
MAEDLERELSAALRENETLKAHHQRDEELLVQRTDEIRALKAEITAERNLHGQTRVVVEELNTICNDLRNAGQPQFVRSEAIRLLREDQAEIRGNLAALSTRLQEREVELATLRTQQAAAQPPLSGAVIDALIHDLCVYGFGEDYGPLAIKDTTDIVKKHLSVAPQPGKGPSDAELIAAYREAHAKYIDVFAKTAESARHPRTDCIPDPESIAMRAVVRVLRDALTQTRANGRTEEAT